MARPSEAVSFLFCEEKLLCSCGVGKSHPAAPIRPAPVQRFTRLSSSHLFTDDPCRSRAEELCERTCLLQSPTSILFGSLQFPYLGCRPNKTLSGPNSTASRPSWTPPRSFCLSPSSSCWLSTAGAGDSLDHHFSQFTLHADTLDGSPSDSVGPGGA